MAIATAIALAAAAASAAAAGASVYSGIQAKKEGKEQAQIAEEQAVAQSVETQRVAERQALLEQRNIDDTVQRQKLAYLASGVTLEGSPLLVMEETRRRGAENIEEIKKAGAAGSTAQLAEGRATASTALNIGRQSLLSGIVGGFSSASKLVKK